MEFYELTQQICLISCRFYIFCVISSRSINAYQHIYWFLAVLNLSSIIFFHLSKDSLGCDFIWWQWQFGKSRARFENYAWVDIDSRIWFIMCDRHVYETVSVCAAWSTDPADFQVWYAIGSADICCQFVTYRGYLWFNSRRVYLWFCLCSTISGSNCYHLVLKTMLKTTTTFWVAFFFSIWKRFLRRTVFA